MKRRLPPLCTPETWLKLPQWSPPSVVLRTKLAGADPEFGLLKLFGPVGALLSCKGSKPCFASSITGCPSPVTIVGELAAAGNGSAGAFQVTPPSWVTYSRAGGVIDGRGRPRSEERRVGKECGGRWWAES